jgi:bisphosphoglycerate-independent phosphoglycerate mutase (AlkP superfamily)
VTISIVSWEPIHGRIVSAADASCATVTGDDEDYVRGDAEVARLAVEALGRHDPDAMFVYFGNVDVAGHNHGFHPSVPQYTDAIHAVDGHVGAVIAALRARPSHADEDWLVLVCTDHGGQGTRHGDGAGVPEIYNTFLIASGPSAPRGAIDAPTALVDVVPTALAHLGVAVDPAWGLDGRDVRTLAGP